MNTVHAYSDEVEVLPCNPQPTDHPYIIIGVELDWSSADPHAVVATFHSGGSEPIVWHFCLDLVTAGLIVPSGMGDVFLTPDPFDMFSVFLVLDSPSHRAGFRMPAEFVSDFLVDVDAASVGVPVVFDWDSELATWLEAS